MVLTVFALARTIRAPLASTAMARAKTTRLEHKHSPAVAVKEGNELRIAIRRRRGWTAIRLDFTSGLFEVRSYSGKAAENDAKLIAAGLLPEWSD